MHAPMTAPFDLVHLHAVKQARDDQRTLRQIRELLGCTCHTELGEHDLDEHLDRLCEAVGARRALRSVS